MNNQLSRMEIIQRRAMMHNQSMENKISTYPTWKKNEQKVKRVDESIRSMENKSEHPTLVDDAPQLTNVSDKIQKSNHKKRMDLSSFKNFDGMNGVTQDESMKYYEDRATNKLSHDTYESNRGLIPVVPRKLLPRSTKISEGFNVKADIYDNITQLKDAQKKDYFK